jgi:hypothetical protein
VVADQAGLRSRSPAAVDATPGTRHNHGVDTLITVVGWLGAALLLLAYGMTSAGRLPPEGVRFQTLNLVGALTLTVNSGYHGAWPSAALNIVWIGIGLVALVRGARRRGGPDPTQSPAAH